MIHWLVILVTLFFGATALAAIPPARFIANQVVRNAGSGLYSYEVDAQFQTGNEFLALKEFWTVESDQSLRLQVYDSTDLKNPQLLFDFLYKQGQRHFVSGNQKKNEALSGQFFERLYFVRQGDRLLREMVEQKILMPSSLEKRVYQASKDIERQDEPMVRLARFGGVVAIAWGAPAPADPQKNERPPGLWIDQDRSLILNYRGSSGFEVSSSGFIEAQRGLHFPKERTVRWGSSQVTLTTLQLSSKPILKSDQFMIQSLKNSSGLSSSLSLEMKTLVEDFYKRFR